MRFFECQTHTLFVYLEFYLMTKFCIFHDISLIRAKLYKKNNEGKKIIENTLSWCVYEIVERKRQKRTKKTLPR